MRGVGSSRLTGSGLVLLAGGCLLLVAPAGAQSVTYTGSLLGSTGDYIFTERTTGLSLVNGLEISAGRLTVSASFPVIGQSTPWVAQGLVPVPSGGRYSGEVARQVDQMRRAGRMGRTMVVLPPAEESLGSSFGVGDPLVGAEVELLTATSSRPSVRVSASAKAPLADPDDGFGTGAWDYGAGAAVTTRVGRGTVLADLAYWRMGDLPDLELRDAAAYGVGYGHLLGSGRWSLLASVAGWTAIIDGAQPPLLLGLGLSRLLDTNRSVSVSVGVGLTETAPDVSIGLGWRLGLSPG